MELQKDDTNLEAGLTVPMNQTDIAQEIERLHDKLLGYAKKSLQLVFEIGKLLVHVRETLDHGQFLPWIADNCPFAERTARKYITVYEHFKSATVADLGNLNIRQAFIEAGAIKVAPPELPAPTEDPSQIKMAFDEEVEKRRLEEIFKVPPLAVGELKKYRVQPRGDTIVYFREGNPIPYTCSQIYIQPRPELHDAHQSFQEDLQAAFERYFAHMEALEDSGVIQPPQDLTRQAMRNRIASKSNKKSQTFEDAAEDVGAIPKRGKK